MRYGRSRGHPDAEVSYYHCVSRIVNREYFLEEREKERFVKMMRAYEEFSGVQIVTFCILSNHVHLLIRVPHRPADADLPSDEELVRLVKVADCHYGSVQLEKDLKELREGGSNPAAETLRERFFCRMWDVSAFLKSLKQRFSQWYNGVHGHCGTLWEGRFKSVLVEGMGGMGRALATMAAYIDLNPVRAGIVDDPAAYRWSGYGEAMAGNQQAREGFRLAVQARLQEELPLKKVLPAYRKNLFEKGIAREAGDEGTPARRGFSEAKVDAVLKAGGKLGLFEGLRCRVRYFCDGVVLGSRAFAEEFFVNNPSHFGPSRQSGSRPLRNLNLPDLYTVRELRSRVITVSHS